MCWLTVCSLLSLDQDGAAMGWGGGVLYDGVCREGTRGVKEEVTFELALENQ